MSTSSNYPQWINYYTLFLGVLGLGAGLTSYFAPQLLFSNITLDFAEITTATGMFAGRNIAFGVMAFLAFFSKNRDFLRLLFVGRLLTEIQDLGVIISTEAVPVPASALVLVWTLFFLLPEGLALKTLKHKK